jgi:hypothetical protein
MEGDHTLCPCDFIEAEADAFLMQRLADQVPSFGRDVVVVFAEYLRKKIRTSSERSVENKHKPA